MSDRIKAYFRKRRIARHQRDLEERAIARTRVYNSHKHNVNVHFKE